MKLTLFIIFLFVFVTVSISQLRNDLDEISIGTEFTVFSKFLDEERKFIIHLPENYDASDDNFPVLFVLDGDFRPTFLEAITSSYYLNYFDNTSNLIIVGVYTSKNRNRDLVPSESLESDDNIEVDNFFNFLTRELKPHINKNYRTNDFNILFGGSNAGLFSLYSILKYPNSFDAVISSSPSIGFCPKLLENYATAFAQNEKLEYKSIYMNYGKTDIRRTLEYLPQFYSNFKDKLPAGYPIILQLESTQGHIPFGSLYEGLKFIFNNN